MVDLHSCETSMSWTHVYHLRRSVHSRCWYHPKTSTSTSGGTRAETGRVLLIDEEIWETAVQRAFVDSQDEFECSGS